MNKNQAYETWKKDPLHPTEEAGLLLEEAPILYAINRGGVYGLDSRCAVYAVAPDPLGVPGCDICLTKWLDGTPVAIRYRRTDIKLAETDLDYRVNNYLHKAFNKERII